ncbi:MAG: NHL repeat-containing protein [Planctomycetota bacterium]
MQFLTSFSGAEDLGAPGAGGFEKFVLGEAEQQERITTPYGVAIFDGTIYVCDVGQRRVLTLDLKNRSFGYLTEDRRLMNPVNIRIQDDGTKYVADPTVGAVFVFDRSNTLQAILGKELEISPIDVAIRGSYCYVTDFASNQIVVFDRETGQEVRRIGEEGDGEQQFKLISDLAFGPEGNLYVTDKLKAKIFEFDESGSLKRTLGRLGDNIDEFVRPKGIALDREGRIWVVDAGVSVSGNLWSTEVAKIYDQQGRLLLFFGGPGSEPGTMSLPAKIVLDYDNVDVFERYAVKDAKIEFLVLVSNQYGPHKVSVYGFGDFPVAERPEPEPPEAAPLREVPRPSEPPVDVPTAREDETQQPSQARQDGRMEQVVLTYYESMAFYRAGRLQEARAGFVEVIESGMIPPAMRRTLEGYLRDIDSRLKDEQGTRP